MAPPHLTSSPKRTQLTIDHFLRSPHKARLTANKKPTSSSRSSLSRRTILSREIQQTIDISSDEKSSDVISISSDDLDPSSDSTTETILSFLRYNRRLLQSLEHSRHENDKSGRIGCYKLGNIASTTLIPLSFEMFPSTSSDPLVAKRLHLHTAMSTWDRRRATLQLCAFADGISRVKPLLVFHSSNPAPLEERLSYSTDVEVDFNPNLHSNDDIILHWIRQIYRHSGEEIRPSSYPEPRLLCVDFLTQRGKDSVKQELAKLGVMTSVVPEGCSSYVEPLHAAIVHPLLTRLTELAENHYNQVQIKSRRREPRLTGTRSLLTRWVGEAWNELHCDRHFVRLVRQTFRRLGFSLNPDGSEDNELRIAEFPDLRVGN